MSDSALAEPPAHDLDTTSKYDRLKHADIGKILRLADEDVPQALIAQQIGCHQSSVSRVLRQLGPDTSDLAIRRFKATALSTAERVITISETAENPDIALKAAKVVLAASGVTERVSGLQVGVQVTIGTQAQPALQASYVTVQTVESRE